MRSIGPGQIALHLVALAALGFCGGWGIYRTIQKRLESSASLVVLMLIGIIANVSLLAWLVWDQGFHRIPTELEIVLVVSAGIGIVSLFLRGYTDSPFPLMIGAFVMMLMMGVETIRFSDTGSYAMNHTIRPHLGLLVHIGPIVISYIAFTTSFICGVLFIFQQRQLLSKQQGFFLEMLPSLQFVDHWNLNALYLGFSLLTIGVIVGMFGGRYLLGEAPRYPWYLDPKAQFTVITWMGYGIVLTIRKWQNVKGKTFAYLSVLCYVILLFTAFGTELFWNNLYHF